MLGRKPCDLIANAKTAQLSRQKLGLMLPSPVLDRSKLSFQPKMFYNDTLPCCTATNLANALLAIGAIVGYEVNIHDDLVPAFYANTINMPGATLDQLAATDGAVELDVLTYQQNIGFGVGEQVPMVGRFGGCALDKTSIANTAEHMGYAYLGVNLYEKDMDCFTNKTPLVIDGSDPGKLVGRHSLGLFDWQGLSGDSFVRLPTYGDFYQASWDWVMNRTEEAWGIFWRELMTGSQLFQGVDPDTLVADLIANQ